MYAWMYRILEFLYFAERTVHEADYLYSGFIDKLVGYEIDGNIKELVICLLWFAVLLNEVVGFS